MTLGTCLKIERESTTGVCCNWNFDEIVSR